MKHIVLLTFILLNLGCTKNQDKNDDSKLNMAQKIIVGTLDTITETLKKDRNKPDIKVLDSPIGLIIETAYASSIEQYKFFEDSVVLFSIVNDYSDNWRLGKWYMNGDSIVMNFYKSVYERGIGEPIYSNGIISAEGPYEEFANYAIDIHQIEEKEKLSWKETKARIEEGFDKFECLNIKYEAEKYDLELKGKFPFASYRKLEKNDLSNYTKKELRLIRNEIFARYGLRFKSQDLLEYFKHEYWYKPYRENVDLFLSNIERENIELIQGLENKD